MSSFKISKIVIDSDEKIHIYKIKISYIFSSIELIEELSKRYNIKLSIFDINFVAKHLITNDIGNSPYNKSRRNTAHTNIKKIIDLEILS